MTGGTEGGFSLAFSSPPATPANNTATPIAIRITFIQILVPKALTCLMRFMIHHSHCLITTYWY